MGKCVSSFLVVRKSTTTTTTMKAATAAVATDDDSNNNHRHSNGRQHIYKLRCNNMKTAAATTAQERIFSCFSQTFVNIYKWKSHVIAVLFRNLIISNFRRVFNFMHTHYARTHTCGFFFENFGISCAVNQPKPANYVDRYVKACKMFRISFEQNETQLPGNQVCVCSRKCCVAIRFYRARNNHHSNEASKQTNKHTTH